MGDAIDSDKLENVEQILQETETSLKSKKSTKKSLVDTSTKLLSVIEDLKVKLYNLVKSPL